MLYVLIISLQYAVYVDSISKRSLPLTSGFSFTALAETSGSR